MTLPSTAGANSFSRTSIDRVAGLYVSGDGSTGTGVLVASAGNNVNIMGGVISNSGKDGATSITAAKDINLASVATAASNNLVWDANNTRKDASTHEVGSAIVGAGSIGLQAGKDINTRKFQSYINSSSV